MGQKNTGFVTKEQYYRLRMVLYRFNEMDQKNFGFVTKEQYDMVRMLL